jgi:hypothetical protein
MMPIKSAGITSGHGTGHFIDMHRLRFLVFAAGTAAIVATVLGSIALDLDIPPDTLRTGALLAVVAVGIALTGGALIDRNK